MAPATSPIKLASTEPVKRAVFSRVRNGVLLVSSVASAA